jgi:hypothetical protein
MLGEPHITSYHMRLTRVRHPTQSFNDNNGQKTSGGALSLAGYPALGEELLGLPMMASSLALTRCTLVGNAVANATGVGGGVFVEDANELYPADTASTCSITDSVLSGNVGAQGGGVYVGAGGALSIAGSALSGNEVSGSGGAVAASGLGVSVSATASNFSGNVAGVAGAALWANGKAGSGSLSLDGCVLDGNAASGPLPHGGGISAENIDAVTLVDCTFSANAVTLTEQVSTSSTAMDVTLQFASTLTYGAGAGGALFAIATGATQLDISGCDFSGNSASDGGALALLSGVNATLAGSTLANNSAAASGGAMLLDGAASGTATRLAAGVRLLGNAAPSGGAVAVAGLHALTADGVAASGNTAEYGAVLYAAASVVNASAQLSLSSVAASQNAASAAGGVLFVQGAAAGDAVPTCAGCDEVAMAASNSAGDYGPVLASPPVRFAVSGAGATRSAALLPLTAVAYDAYGAVVRAWPQLVATVACFDAAGRATPGAVSGVAPAVYADGAAAFASLTLSGAVGAAFTLALTLSSGSAPAFAAGLSVNASVTVQPCDVSEAFDAAALRCGCVANAIRLVADAPSCVCANDFFWSAAAGACDACPDGVVCRGGDALTDEGYWRLSANDSLAYDCGSGRCRAVQAPASSSSSSSSSARRRLHASNGTSLLAGANCSVGHTGPLCAICCTPLADGCDDGRVYAFQGDVCVACSPADEWSNWARWQRGVLLAFVVLGALAALLFGFYLPLLPRLSHLLMRLYTKLLIWASRGAHLVCGAPPPDVSQQRLRAHKSLRLKAHLSGKIPGTELQAGEARESRTSRTSAGAGGGYDDADGAPVPDVNQLKREHQKLNFLQLQARFERLMRPAKIIINFLQVAMSFPTTLHVAWPRVFYRIAARLSVVNVHLLSLPSLACTNPEPSYYRIFHGYTLGCCLAVVLVAVIYAFGVALHALLGGSRTDKRFNSFTNRCVTAALVVLYIAYPSVSQVVVNMLSCQQLRGSEGDADAPYYLRADFRIRCYTPTHRAYMAAAAWWIIVFPVGVPLLFFGALWYYDVPRMARAKADAAWLCEAADWAARHAGLAPPPDVDTRTLSGKSMPDEYLAALHALFCGGEGGADAEAAARESRRSSRSHGMLAWARGGGEGAAPATPAASDAAPLSREEQLGSLLRWCRTGGVLSLPPLQWRLKNVMEEEAETPAARAAPPLPPSDAERLAEDRVGFLFEAYRVQTFYWEVVELLRKFLLTGVMSMVSPGSAAQVVMGLLVAFGAVVAYARLSPYAEPGVNRLGLLAQLNLFFFLLVALLLKVKADGADHDSNIYNGVVGTLSLSLLVVPPLNKIIQAFSEDVDPGMDT